MYYRLNQEFQAKLPYILQTYRLFIKCCVSMRPSAAYCGIFLRVSVCTLPETPEGVIGRYGRVEKNNNISRKKYNVY